jgi:hypothetical protein
METLLGIRADSWFDGFLGAILAGLIAVLVAYLTARGQTKSCDIRSSETGMTELFQHFSWTCLH